MPLEPRHQYERQRHEFVLVGDRPGIVRSMELDIHYPRGYTVQFRDGLLPKIGFFTPEQVKVEITDCDYGCKMPTTTILGHRCSRCGAPK